MLSATFLYAVLLISCRSSTLDSFVMTPSAPASDGGGNLDVTLNWKDTSYQCSFSPSDLSSLVCDNNTWIETSITADIYVPYHFKLVWTESTLPFIFESIEINDASSNIYTIADFCIRLVYIHTYAHIIYVITVCI